jgi:hypothetical protein
MKLKDWLVPTEGRFFDLLENESRNVIRGAEALLAMLEKGHDFRAGAEAVKAIEHEGDGIVHGIFEQLNATFITPIDREDIAKLASTLDDVLDFTYSTANRISLYEIQTIPPSLVDLARTLREQVHHLDAALRELRHPSRREEVYKHLIEIHRLENHADEVLHRSLHDFFLMEDVKQLLKLKEVHEFLETATDKAEDAADVLRDTLVKSQ